MKKRRRSKKTSWAWLAFFPVLTLLVLLAKCGNSSPKENKTQNVETMVMLLLSQTPTATVTPILTNTPLPSETPIPTNTSTTEATEDVCHDISCGCKIWGNVNKNKGTKIYHCPNDPNYYPENFKASQGDQWFCTEAEAIAAGFRPPKNAPDCGGLN